MLFDERRLVYNIIVVGNLMNVVIGKQLSSVVVFMIPCWQCQVLYAHILLDTGALIYQFTVHQCMAVVEGLIVGCLCSFADKTLIKADPIGQVLLS